jgi:predicted TIM-barrel fold metal-dependent hydrolase
VDLSSIPLYDHDCHALRKPGAALDAAAFRSHFTESRDPAMAPHVTNSLFYRRGIRELAARLGCDPTEESVLTARGEAPLQEYARRLVTAANLDVMLVDTGYRGAENYALEEESAFLPCAVHEVLRLETLAERLIVESRSFGDLEDAFRHTLQGARAQGVRALKSVAAYRGGLEILPRSREEAGRSFAALKQRADREGRVRLEDRPMLEYLLRVAVEAAAAQGLPVQFHTGFGDDDADLRSANPVHLRALLQDPGLRGAPVVLLHCWPFVREAGYLAALYGHVYVDLSLTVPFTAHGGAAAVRMALEQAPWSKLLLSTDAFSIPELFYLGALFARRSLAAALDELRDGGWLGAAEVHQAAEAALHGNALRLYGA